MNPDLLLAHFNRISDAPDAVPRFRQFIIDLSVRGKLVDQDPRDKPASELLERVKNERKRLQKNKASQHPQVFTEIEAIERPYSLPNSWEWIRLGECLEMINGRAFKPTDWLPAGLPIVRIQNLNADIAPFNYCDESAVEQRHIIDSGCFLISWSGTPGTSFGAFIWKRGKAALNQHIFKCVQIGDAYYDRFLQIAVNGRLDEMIAKAHGGVGLQHITKGKLENLPLSLPPLAEQHRIVAKVDELMLFCDRLEASQRDRESQRNRLAASAHHYLNNGATAVAFKSHARFFTGHVPVLTARPDQIPDLRKTVLSLAVRGQLVSQTPTDEPASVLIQRIQAEKTRLEKGRILRKEKPLAPVADDEVPFSVPTTWIWARIGACSLLTEYGTSVKSDQVESGVPVLKMGDIQEGRVILGGQKKVPQNIDDLPQLFLKRFDLLYNRTNSAELVGKTGIYLGDDDAYTFASYLIRIRFLNNLTSPLYVNLAMNAPYFRATQIVPELQQQCGQANVNGSKLRNMLIPLPPLAEQQRIVAKVGELMAVCDRLESQLTNARAATSRLLESVLHHTLYDTEATASTALIANETRASSANMHN